MSMDALRPSERTIRALRRWFIALIVISVAGLGLALLLNLVGWMPLDHPVVMILVGLLIVAAGLEFALESLRQAGRHEDGWWRP